MQFRTVPQPDVDALDALIVPVYSDGTAAPRLPVDLRRTAEWLAGQSEAVKTYTATTHLRETETGATRLIVVAAGRREEYGLEQARRVASAGIRALWLSTARRAAIALDVEELGVGAATQAAVEGALYSMWRPEMYRTTDQEKLLPPLEEVQLLAEDEAPEAIERGVIVGEAVNWARRMANEPANLLTPTLLAEAAEEVARGSGLQAEVLDEERCRELGMGSFLSVARGSDEPARFVVLRHHGREGDGYDLALVGKGITFDSGGISIKPAEDMHVMKYDMSGAAGVIAAIGAVARLGVPLNVIAAAPCTENLPGGHATKPGDVVTSMSGKTVEVINTDAEGRLVLLDAVTYVQREGAARVVDVATLTGAIRIALGVHYTGLFGRPEGFVDSVRRAGVAAGERLWPMPLSDEYRDEMKSDVADLRNSSSRLGSAIKGAAFIEAAVEPETEWAHLDIAGTGWADDDRPFSPKGPQGSAVRTLISLAQRLAARS
ncbi:MAG TPA: leucyl aminopeptidase [Candidatus Caenarcaniphilales bacterium]|nr:leucyl aminopeptidase [Candidatus Caenarcaniphilales bacterium]